MKPEQVIKALTRIEEMLVAAKVRPERAPTHVGGVNLERKIHLKHILWMVQEAKNIAYTLPDKAERWLCFAQGVMWTSSESTIDEFKDDNRSPKD